MDERAEEERGEEEREEREERRGKEEEVISTIYKKHPFLYFVSSVGLITYLIGKKKRENECWLRN